MSLLWETIKAVDERIMAAGGPREAPNEVWASLWVGLPISSQEGQQVVARIVDRYFERVASGCHPEATLAGELEHMLVLGIMLGQRGGSA